MNAVRGMLLLIHLVFLSACGSLNTERKIPPAPARPSSPPAKLLASAPDLRPVIVAFGNSLTAGLGVAPEESYPGKLQRKIDVSGYNFRVVNAGVSGDTSAQGVNRLQTVLDMHPAIVIMELGANDGLRGLPVDATRANLETIVKRLKETGSEVIIAGMEMPPNYGPAYTGAFRKIFPEVAARNEAPLVPFLLEGVGGHPELNQGDGIHPTEKGYDIVVENIWRVLEPLLQKHAAGARSQRQ